MARQPPQDRREFVRICVDLPTHEKVCNTEDPPLAGWLYVTGICTAGAALSDGLIVPRAAVRKAGVPLEVAKWLVSEGLWHEPGHDCPRCPQPPEGKVFIHDYPQHNRSKRQAEAAREAGRQAAAARWGNADRMPTAYDPHADSTAVGMRIASEPDSDPHDPCDPDADRMPTAVRNRCDLDAEVQVQEEEQTPASPFVGGSGGDASQQAAPPDQGRKRGTRITIGWTPSQRKRETLTARFQRSPQWWLDETDKFVNWFIQKSGRDATSLDWDARFDVWIREAIRREGTPNSAPANGRRYPTRQEAEQQATDEMFNRAMTRAIERDEAEAQAKGLPSCPNE